MVSDNLQHGKKRLVFIMGTHRSGTTILLNALGAADTKQFRCFHEKNPIVFDTKRKSLYLHPAAVIKKILQDSTKSIITKPINDISIRPLKEILSEYEEIPLEVIWVYRNPVDVFYSRIRYWPDNVDLSVTRFLDNRPPKNQYGWIARNQFVLDAIKTHPNTISIVRLEDLIASSEVFEKLCAYHAIAGKYIFTPITTDSGTDCVPAKTQELIFQKTKDTMTQLDANRRFVP